MVDTDLPIRWAWTKRAPRPDVVRAFNDPFLQNSGIEVRLTLHDATDDQIPIAFASGPMIQSSAAGRCAILPRGLGRRRSFATGHPQLLPPTSRPQRTTLAVRALQWPTFSPQKHRAALLDRSEFRSEPGCSSLGGRLASSRWVVYAAQALIFERDDRVFKSHKGVQGEFARLVKDDPSFDVDLRAFLGRTYSLKAIADYEAGAGPK